MHAAPEIARNAYAAAAQHRSLRAQEADVFRRANAALRRARTGGTVAEARALADNDRLWMAVTGAVRDPDNRLPATLRAGLASLGAAVCRETRAKVPDWDFLIAVNEDMIAGLSSAG